MTSPSLPPDDFDDGRFPPAESALNLRLALALFGVVSCTFLGVLALLAGGGLLFLVLGGLLLALGVVGAVDVVVILRRRRVRAAVDARSGTSRSLFE